MEKIPSLDRKGVHERFLERFTSRTMCEKYVEVYNLGIMEKKRGYGAEHGLSLTA